MATQTDHLDTLRQQADQIKEDIKQKRKECRDTTMQQVYRFIDFFLSPCLYRSDRPYPREYRSASMSTPSAVFKCALGERYAVTWPRSTPCIGQQTQGTWSRPHRMANSLVSFCFLLFRFKLRFELVIPFFFFDSLGWTTYLKALVDHKKSPL